MPAPMITIIIAHSHHFLKIDCFGSSIVATAGVVVGVAVVGCVATGFVFLTGIVFGSSTMNIIRDWSL